MSRRGVVVRSRLHPRTELRRIEAYQGTTSDGEAARCLRVSPVTFASWRVRRGLPAKHAPPGEPILSHLEHERRAKAYHTHTTDSAAAKALGLPRGTFRAWRDVHRLPAKRTRPERIDASEEARRRAAYDATSTDDDAARALGMGIGGFKWWRQQRGLPGKGGGGPSVAVVEDQRRHRAYDGTSNDIEAAARLGLTQSGFQRWRAKMGLPAKTPNRGQHVTPREEARRLRAYQRGLTDEETAQKFGLRLATYRGWRQAQGLPAHRRPLHAGRKPSRMS